MRELFERLRRYLEGYLAPEDSLLEVVGGVILVLATVNTIVVTRDRAGVDAILKASFAVAIAWGLVDAAMGLFGTVYHRKHQERIVRSVGAADDAGGRALMAQALDDELLDLAEPAARDEFVHHLSVQARQDQAPRPAVNRDDLIAAALTALLMFSATLPLSIPLLFVDDPGIGVFAVNAVAFVFLFLIGFLWADYTTMSRVKLGLSLASIALALTAVTIFFG
jgi:VIT1/CCC1 family predicted Fe2+/Mn2+ transporter